MPLSSDGDGMEREELELMTCSFKKRATRNTDIVPIKIQGAESQSG